MGARGPQPSGKARTKLVGARVREDEHQLAREFLPNVSGYLRTAATAGARLKAAGVPREEFIQTLGEALWYSAYDESDGSPP